MAKSGLIAAILSLSISGCATNTGVIPATHGNFTVMRQGSSFLVSTAELKAQGMKEASDLCASKRKEVKVIHVKEIQAGPFGRWPETEILFTCT